ncbi:GerMN domain-containing protein [Clostridium aminobutyricum]|uniref:GerMN domain-containing protein n=1 Tax=Clostridium aminobutyricum TaxID=33953 RepID=A0A939D9T8_CLOAM|nr:GerMN domain-containing protein [Clostridium aminobutyricum]MBN7773852.1 GerMN domain-containing protein [Clostridium aminobutyricum]
MKNQWIKILCFSLVIVLVIGMTISLGACGTKEDTSKVEYPLKLYFVSKDFVETGDESKDPLIEYDGKSVYCDKNTDDQYLNALTMLWQVPEDLKNAETEVTEKYGIHDVYLKDDVAYVDLSSKDLSGGSFQETLLISQIVLTLGKSFDEIKSVQFLVDGKVVESLMGHVDVTEPILVADYQSF